MTGFSASTLFRAWAFVTRLSDWLSERRQYDETLRRRYVRRKRQRDYFYDKLTAKLEANEKELAELRSKVQPSDSVVK